MVICSLKSNNIIKRGEDSAKTELIPITVTLLNTGI